MDSTRPKKAAVIVAHPDDETLWAGGTILSQPSWQWFILCLTRKIDAERAIKFNQALKALGAKGIMGNLDDGPEQTPLVETELEESILQLLPSTHYDLIITHHPHGEYTRHLRHEETSKAVITLWNSGRLATTELWTFAYEDGDKQYYPRAIKSGQWSVVGGQIEKYRLPITDYRLHFFELPKHTWEKKYEIITGIYGFKDNSWEAKTTPKEESFIEFTDSEVAMKWLILNERMKANFIK